MSKPALYLGVAMYFVSVCSIVDIGTEYVSKKIGEIESARAEKLMREENMRGKEGKLFLIL
jgi:hypothetical protein